jgi:hypothetical protein
LDSSTCGTWLSPKYSQINARLWTITETIMEDGPQREGGGWLKIEMIREEDSIVDQVLTVRHYQWRWRIMVFQRYEIRSVRRSFDETASGLVSPKEGSSYYDDLLPDEAIRTGNWTARASLRTENSMRIAVQFSDHPRNGGKSLKI